MVEVPTPIPVITPDELMVTLDGSLLLHVPPVPLLKGEAVPTHILTRPVIAGGTGFTFTVTLVAELQPAALVAVTV